MQDLKWGWPFSDVVHYRVKLVQVILAKLKRMFCLACHAKHGVKILQHHVRAKKIEPANIVILRNIFFIFSSETRPGNIYFFKVSYKSTTKWFEICSSLTIKTPEWRHWRCFDVFTVNLEHISQLSSSVYIVGFEQFNVFWTVLKLLML